MWFSGFFENGTLQISIVHSITSFLWINIKWWTVHKLNKYVFLHFCFWKINIANFLDFKFDCHISQYIVNIYCYIFLRRSKGQIMLVYKFLQFYKFSLHLKDTIVLALINVGLTWFCSTLNMHNIITFDMAVTTVWKKIHKNLEIFY